MSNLRITIVQSHLHWEDATANRAMFAEKLNQISDTHIILLPETFTTGFSMHPHKLAEHTNGKTTGWMKQIAAEKKAVIAGSALVEDAGKYYNRLLWVQPGGKVLKYDKRHLFSLTGEEKVMTPGAERLIVQHNEWKICPLICYDLRFPTWSRNRLMQNGEALYDVLVYVANWPERRSYAWKQLLVARAIENQCYVVGVNRVGNDGNDIYHSGDSLVIDPLGQVLFHAADKEVVHTLSLDLNLLKSVRTQFSFLKDADDFETGAKQKFKSH